MKLFAASCAIAGAIWTGGCGQGAPAAAAPTAGGAADPVARAQAGGGPQQAKPPRPVKLSGTVPGADARGYVGRERCEQCHAKQHDEWLSTMHSRSLRPASRATIHAPFEGDKASVGAGTAGFRAFERDGKLFIHTLGPDGKMGDFEIHYSIGDRRAHMLIHKMADGRLQVLPSFVDIPGRYWFPHWEFFFDIDSKGPIWPHENRFWTNPGRGFNAAVFSELCINCHTTGPRRNYDAATNTYDSTWVDMTVACEACHGPGAAHVERREYLQRGLATAEQAANWVPLKMLEGEAVMEVCAQCHASKQQLRTGYRPGADWFDYYMPVLLDDAVHVHPDGKFKQLNYNWLAIQQSPCFTKGKATCGTCHSAHGAEHVTDLRHDQYSNELCLQCHQELRDDLRGHTRHSSDSRGSKCVNCHMPYITIENGHGKIRDHTMSIPRPRNHRVHAIPDACTTCHVGRKPEWAETVMRKWWPRGTPDRHEWIADVIAAGRKQDPSGRAGLLMLLADRDAHWIYRASAARLLNRYPGPRVRDSLLAIWRTPDDHPVMRPSALFGLLGHTADPDVLNVVRAALDDEQIAARQNAAFGLVYLGDAVRAADCRKVIEGIVEFLPDNVDHRGALAKACALMGEFEAAWGHWVVCLNIFPMSKSTVGGATGLARERATATRRGGDDVAGMKWAERAVEAASRYVDRRPGDAWGHVTRAYARMDARQWAAAVEDLDAALKAGVPEQERPGLVALRQQAAEAAAAGGGR